MKIVKFHAAIRWHCYVFLHLNLWWNDNCKVTFDVLNSTTTFKRTEKCNAMEIINRFLINDAVLIFQLSAISGDWFNVRIFSRSNYLELFKSSCCFAVCTMHYRYQCPQFRKGLTRLLHYWVLSKHIFCKVVKGFPDNYSVHFIFFFSKYSQKLVLIQFQRLSNLL